MSLPSLDIRNLVSLHTEENINFRKDFEKNYPHFTDCVVNISAKFILNEFQSIANKTELRNESTFRQSWNVSFDITNQRHLNYFKKIIKTFTHLPPFKNLVENLCIDGLDETSRENLLNLMERIAILAEEKFEILFKNYCAIPLHNILQYEIKREKTRIKVYLKIERENKWPPFEKLLVSKKKEESLLPSIDMRELGRKLVALETNFENNHKKFADKIADEIIPPSLNKLKERLNCSYSPLPKKDTPVKFRADFAVNNPTNIFDLYNRTHYGSRQCFIREVSPFNTWLVKFPNEKMAQDEINFYQGFINRLAHATQECISTKLEKYPLEHKNDLLKFEVGYSETEMQLTVNLWIEEEPKELNKKERKSSSSAIKKKYDTYENA